jgi:hypothetical protein
MAPQDVQDALGVLKCRVIGRLRILDEAKPFAEGFGLIWGGVWVLGIPVPSPW